MFRPNYDTEINSIGQEAYFDAEEGKWKWRHVARNCDFCFANRSTAYGFGEKWYCTDCWIEATLVQASL